MACKLVGAAIRSYAPRTCYTPGPASTTVSKGPRWTVPQLGVTARKTRPKQEAPNSPLGLALEFTGHSWGRTGGSEEGN